MPQRTTTETYRHWKCPVCAVKYNSPINIRGFVCGNKEKHPVGKPKVDMKPEEG